MNSRVVLLVAVLALSSRFAQAGLLVVADESPQPLLVAQAEEPEVQTSPSDIPLPPEPEEPTPVESKSAEVKPACTVPTPCRVQRGCGTWGLFHFGCGWGFGCR